MTAHQLSLLSAVPASHRDDPAPSRQAERAVTESGSRATNQHRVLEGVRRHPGLTSKELAARLNMDRVEVARRLPDLKNVHVWQGAARVCTADPGNHRKATTWWPSKAKAEASHIPEQEIA